MGEQVVPGRRERKKLATRAALAEAALRLCSERGFENVTVEQIADDADVAVRTFFNYFPSKEEAVVAGDSEAAGRLVRTFRDRPADEPVFESLRHALLALVDDPGHRRRVRRLRLLRGNPSLLAHQIAAFVVQERELARAVADRVGADVDRDVYPSLVAAAAMTGIRVAVQRWEDTDPDGNADAPGLTEIVDTVMAMLGSGLGTAPRPAIVGA